VRPDDVQDRGKATRAQGWNPLLKSYPQSEKVNSLSIGAETLFTRLIAQADDFGNYYSDPALICAYLFGHRMAKGEVSATDTTRWRDELMTQGLAVQYAVAGRHYLHVVNSHRRLRKDVRPHQLFPREPANCEQPIGTELTGTVRERVDYGTDTGRTRDERVAPDPDPDRDPYPYPERTTATSPSDGREEKGPPVTKETETRKAKGAAVCSLDSVSIPSPEASLEPSEARGGIAETEGDPAERALNYFNRATGKKFTARPVALAGARERLNEGATFEDLCLVIDYKVAQWSGRDLTRSWLHPQTLFSEKHWDGYIQDARDWDEKGRPAIKDGSRSSISIGMRANGQGLDYYEDKFRRVGED